MAISRSSYSRHGIQGLTPYAKTGGEIIQYISNGSNPNDFVGATYRVHIFDTVGADQITFESDGYVDLLLVGGGAAGGAAYNGSAGGGGGAGGLVQYYGYGVNAGTYSLEVGRGGEAVFETTTSYGGRLQGKDSSFAGLTAFGGGAAGSHYDDNARGGGSGGGASDGANYGGGLGVSGQGHPGGNNLANGGERAAGGGGAGQPGSDVSASQAGHGGDGLAVAFYGNEAIYYAGGGAGSQRGAYTATPTGGLGGGANGVQQDNVYGIDAFYYGGGGSGGTRSSTSWHRGGYGYQGIVMVRYRIA